MTIDFTTERLNNTAGIALAGQIFSSIGLDLNDYPHLAHKEVIKIMAGLFLQGRISFAEIEMFKNDLLFQKSLDLKYTPAQETLRLYLEQLAKGKIEPLLDLVNQRLIKKATLSTVDTDNEQYIPVDIDVSPMDNSRSFKEGVGRTYKGFDGYAPIFAYIGAEGYMLTCEQRPGKQHCQKNAPQFIEKTLEAVNSLNLKTASLFRMDSGHDAKETMRVLLKSEHKFIIKKNLRRESPLKWLDLAMAIGEKSTPRDGKSVYTGVLTGPYPTGENDWPDIDHVFKVIVRDKDPQGNPLLFPDLQVEIYLTNLPEDHDTIIELYHNHGLSEQFHSELKSDMNIEKFPSGKMNVNSLLLHIAMIAFNTLRYIGQQALRFKHLLPYKHNVKRKRLRKVIDDLIRVACKLVYHAKQWKIKLWLHDPWYPVFKELFQTM